MSTTMGNILRRATRKPGDRMNILSFPTHESYQSNMENVNADFYLLNYPGLKKWVNYRQLPKNHHLLEESHGDNQIPIDLNIDAILCQNAGAHYNLVKNISNSLHIPIINLCHVLPPPNVDNNYINQFKQMGGHINVFISDFSRNVWGYNEENAHVIHHGLDTNRFKPGKNKRENVVLSVCNDFRGRNWCLNFDLWEKLVKNIPYKLLGDNPGLSAPSTSLYDLIRTYQYSKIFLNTSKISPIPMSFLEAAACGCAIVSSATCEIPKMFQHGVNCLLSNDERELKSYIDTLLKNDSLSEKLGTAARQLMIDKYNINRFTNDWNNILELSASII